MNAQSAAGTAGSNPRGSRSEHTQQLAVLLRSMASRVADEVGSGLALVFAAAPGEDSPEGASRLRAAAGFAMAESAREAAQQLMTSVREVIDGGEPRQLEALPSLGERAAGGLWIQPLAFQGRARGALVVGAPQALDADRTRALAEHATALALHLDHAHLSAELELSRGRIDELSRGGTTDTNDEILKLSEALFAQDIELLRSSEKLGKVEKLKNDFIEKMSRELRTPLNSIIEAIISVLTSEDEHLSDDSKSTLRRALDDGTEFLRTLQNILDLWRIKQSEMPVEIGDVNFSETLDEAIFSIQDCISGKPLTIEQHIPEPLPKLRTDLAKLNQILFLLLENAVKFTPKGTVTISAELRGEKLRCAIEDTGIGICPDDQQFIFDEFYQVDEPASRTYAGAGLGLALVRDLVTLLDGEIGVHSDAGRGTTMSFEIPVQTTG